MSSPFPGMDPYLERHRLDIHTRLITYGSDQLNRNLPKELIARVEERMAVEIEPGLGESSGTQRTLSPDVRVFEAVEEVGGQAAAGGGTALAPYRLVLLDERATERFIEILDVRGGERLVTVIEFVSPANKTGKGLEAFVTKRNELLAGGVNFVEIDLVRAGDWRRLLEPHACPAKAESAYRAVIRVPGVPSTAYLHPISLREPLPVVKIPLRAADAPCDLPLQPLIEDSYRNGRYDLTLNYDRPCDPALDREDAPNGLILCCEPPAVGSWLGEPTIQDWD